MLMPQHGIAIRSSFSRVAFASKGFGSGLQGGSGSNNNGRKSCNCSTAGKYIKVQGEELQLVKKEKYKQKQ